jgi:hypothetical protein
VARCEADAEAQRGAQLTWVTRREPIFLAGMQAAQQNRLALRLAGCSDDYGVALSVTGAAPAALIALFKTFNGNAATGLAPAGVNTPGEAVFRSQRCAFVHEWCVDNVMPCNAAIMCRALLQWHH